MTERNKTVAVIGGLGRMGRVTGEIFEKAGYNPIISDIKDSETLPAREAIRQAGIVFFSVLPIESIEDIIRATSDLFDENHRVLDNATFKNPLAHGYEILNEKKVSIFSTHPLCKEDQPLYGENVLMAPFGHHPEAAKTVAEDIYKKAGMTLVSIDFEKHDLTMLYNQLVPHLINRSIGHDQAENGVDVKALFAISTANSKLFSLANWRTLIQPPEISATIIASSLKTSEGRKIVKNFLDAIGCIAGESADPEKLAETFKKDADALDSTGEIRAEKNDETTIILQHLANLARCSFVAETHEKDRKGLLRDALTVAADGDINLNTTLSQIIKGGFKFHLGIQDGRLTPEVIEEFRQIGFEITRIKE